MRTPNRIFASLPRRHHHLLSSLSINPKSIQCWLNASHSARIWILLRSRNNASLNSDQTLHHEAIRRRRFADCHLCTGSVSGNTSNVSAYIFLLSTLFVVLILTLVRFSIPITPYLSTNVRISLLVPWQLCCAPSRRGIAQPIQWLWLASKWLSTLVSSVRSILGRNNCGPNSQPIWETANYEK